MTDREWTILAIGLSVGSIIGLVVGAILTAGKEADEAFDRSIRTLHPEDPLERAYRDNAAAVDHEQDYHYRERTHEA